jgi:methionyl aminopeptidase
MTADSEEDIAKLKKAGQVAGLALQKMKQALQPGMTTRELDDIGRKFIEEQGAHSAPILIYNFPGATCISINDEAAHGIPGSRIIQPGDMVNIDVSIELDGYFSDTGATVPVPPIANEDYHLCKSTQLALETAIASVRAGQRLNTIGQLVEEVARKNGYRIIRVLTGHGIGRSLHEEPSAVWNYYNPSDNRVMHEGMVIAIEPFLTPGSGKIWQDDDGWTLRTRDGSHLAQYEHTIIVTNQEPIILTAV